MNRRNFLNSILVTGASFAILPGAGRVWKAQAVTPRPMTIWEAIQEAERIYPHPDPLDLEVMIRLIGEIAAKRGLRLHSCLPRRPSNEGM